MKLLVTVQALDRDDPISGFLVRWIDAMARRVESLHVVASRVGRHARRRNLHVTSLGKERGAAKPARVAAFVRTALSRSKLDAALVLQIAEMAVALGPVLRPRGIPIHLWYAHRAQPAALRAALLVVRRAYTSHRNALRLPTRKKRVIGQGIDTEFFSPGRARDDGRPVVLSAGRLSPIKDPMTLIRAAAHLDDACRIRFVGGPLTREDRAFVSSLRRHASDRIRFDEPAPPSRMPAVYRASAVTVNLAPTGAPDKAALEALACGIPTLACNESFRNLLPGELRFRHGDADDLGRKLRALLRRSARNRVRLGASLRKAVVQKHGLQGFMDRLIGSIEGDDG